MSPATAENSQAPLPNSRCDRSEDAAVKQLRAPNECFRACPQNMCVCVRASLVVQSRSSFLANRDRPGMGGAC